ncbi:MAG: hypothetical protein QM621_05920 [Aeromicrobium sp.]|uniref:hypothetical protein n=1 Tax=Aeromicrobium sp. TaxID=1871063 RepID=UPI0039E64F72
MRQIRRTDDAVVVEGDDRDLTYRPRQVTLSDGGWVAHASRGGTLNSVWAVDLGARFVEVVHLGAGPSGGELVVVVPDADAVLIGDLGEEADGPVPASWPEALTHVLQLVRPTTRVLTTSGELTRDELESFVHRIAERIDG